MKTILNQYFTEAKYSDYVRVNVTEFEIDIVDEFKLLLLSWFLPQWKNDFNAFW